MERSGAPGESIREATAADRDAILELRARCFGDVDPEKRDARFWEWELGAGRSFVGANAGGLVTHIALVPLPYAIGGQVMPGALAVDAMTAPAGRGKGWLTRAVGVAMDATRGDFALATAYQIRREVLGPMLRGGWQVAASVPVLVRPVFGVRWPSHRFAPQSRALGRADVQAMSRAAGTPRPGEAMVARRPDFLAWRFFDNPHWQYRVTGVDDADGLAAYLVARRTSLRGFDTWAIADLGYRSASAARLLVRDAVAEAKERGCQLTAALVSWRHPALPLFLLRGYVPGPHRFRLLVHPMAGAVDVARLRWRILWADTDHL
jgi:hypothetical protein